MNTQPITGFLHAHLYIELVIFMYRLCNLWPYILHCHYVVAGYHSLPLIQCIIILCEYVLYFCIIIVHTYTHS